LHILAIVDALYSGFDPAYTISSVCLQKKLGKSEKFRAKNYRPKRGSGFSFNPPVLPFFSQSRGQGSFIKDQSNIEVVRALSDVSFTLQKGDRLGLVGSNGAGKTTLIRTLAGIYEPTHGSIAVEGTRVPMFDIGLGLDEEATGYENIYIKGLILGLPAKEIRNKMTEIAEYSGLGHYLDMPFRTYSEGMRLRLVFAIATSVEGDIILMDEWIAVGDAEFQQKTHERLREKTFSSGILVIASHNPGLLREICNLGIHLEGGAVKKFGPIEDVLAELEMA
jgi:ABC-2 type transport system ATP-binding protein